MRLAALVESPDHVCCRYRLAAFRPHLAAAGHSLDLRPPAPLAAGPARASAAGLRGADVVVLQRKLLSPLGLTRSCAGGRSGSSSTSTTPSGCATRYSPKGFDEPRSGRRGSARRVRRCDAGRRRQRLPRRRGAALDDGPARSSSCRRASTPARYPLAGHAVRRAGASSSGSARPAPCAGLDARSAARSRPIGRRRPGVAAQARLRPRSSGSTHLPGRACPVDARRRGGGDRRADVGIGWVPDDPWSRGKCGLKVLQYHGGRAAGGGQPGRRAGQMVVPGVTGFLARTAGEWVAAVRRLAGDPALRKRMGAAGRRSVEERYSVRAGAEAWLKLLSRWEHRRACA